MNSVAVAEYNANPAFSRVLTPVERQVLVALNHAAQFRKDSVAYVERRVRNRLPELLSDLEVFFVDHPGTPFFLRLSTLSPKDAFRTEHVPDTDLSVLKVYDAMRCLVVLCHSMRARIDLDFEMGDEAIVLLPWLELNHATETRLFVRGARVIAASQYYVDDPAYVPDEAFLRDAIALVERHPILARRPDVSADVCLDTRGRVVLVEFNNLDENLDPCLFDGVDQLVPGEMRWAGGTQNLIICSSSIE